MAHIDRQVNLLTLDDLYLALVLLHVYRYELIADFWRVLSTVHGRELLLLKFVPLLAKPSTETTMWGFALAMLTAPSSLERTAVVKLWKVKYQSSPPTGGPQSCVSQFDLMTRQLVF